MFGGWVAVSVIASLGPLCGLGCNGKFAIALGACMLQSHFCTKFSSMVWEMGVSFCFFQSVIRIQEMLRIILQIKL